MSTSDSGSSWRFVAALVVSTAAVGGVFWLTQRPTLDELRTREALASLALTECRQNAFADCSTQQTALDDARAALDDATR